MAGTNVVNTAAVAVAAMNYDPRAPKGTVPFERSDNKLLLAEQLGVGSADPSRIEVVGLSIQEVMFDFRALREKQRGLRRPLPTAAGGEFRTEDRQCPHLRVGFLCAGRPPGSTPRFWGCWKAPHLTAWRWNGMPR